MDNTRHDFNWVENALDRFWTPDWEPLDAANEGTQLREHVSWKTYRAWLAAQMALTTGPRQASLQRVCEGIDRRLGHGYPRAEVIVRDAVPGEFTGPSFEDHPARKVVLVVRNGGLLERVATGSKSETTKVMKSVAEILARKVR